MAGRGKLLRRLSRDSPQDQGEEQQERSGTSVKLLAKYSYKANPNRPGGFDEVDIKQGENVWLLKKGYMNNYHWWQIEKNDGQCGYAPAQYLMVQETKVTSLPWLDKAPTPAEQQGDKPPVQLKFKSYVPAYKDNAKQTEDSFYCKLCDRKFNGPIPFKAHMKSKAHKEEEEISRQYGGL